MLIPNLRQANPETPWRASQRQTHRGATRLESKKHFTISTKPVVGYLKTAGWLMIAVIVALIVYGAVNRVVTYVNQPISKVRILGDLNYVDQLALQKRIEPYVTGGFLEINLEELRIKLEKTPWVSHVEVERVWPDQVNIHLFGKHPVARWGENSLLNNVGEAFVPHQMDAYKSLPLLDGPDYAQSQVMQQYQIISQLLRPMEFSVASLTLSDRGGWSLMTNTGIELVLGSDDLLGKVRRFTKAYDSNLATKMDNIAKVDLRYANGLAVTWKDPTKEMNVNATKIVARQ